MDVYTANQLQKLVNDAYTRGWQDARLRRDDAIMPPKLEELIDHSYKGSIYECKG